MNGVQAQALALRLISKVGLITQVFVDLRLCRQNIYIAINDINHIAQFLPIRKAAIIRYIALNMNYLEKSCVRHLCRSPAIQEVYPTMHQIDHVAYCIGMAQIF